MLSEEMKDCRTEMFSRLYTKEDFGFEIADLIVSKVYDLCDSTFRSASKEDFEKCCMTFAEFAKKVMEINENVMNVNSNDNETEE